MRRHLERLHVSTFTAHRHSAKRTELSKPGIPTPNKIIKFASR